MSDAKLMKALENCVSLFDEIKEANLPMTAGLARGLVEYRYNAQSALEKARGLFKQPATEGAADETPRTEAAVIPEVHGDTRRRLFVYADFARQLERELSALRLQLAGVIDNRNYFCASINRVAKLIGMTIENASPDAVERNTKQLIEDLRSQVQSLEDKQRFHEIEIHNANLGRVHQIELIDQQDAELQKLKQQLAAKDTTLIALKDYIEVIIHKATNPNLK